MYARLAHHWVPNFCVIWPEYPQSIDQNALPFLRRHFRRILKSVDEGWRVLSQVRVHQLNWMTSVTPNSCWVVFTRQFTHIHIRSQPNAALSIFTLSRKSRSFVHLFRGTVFLALASGSLPQRRWSLNVLTSKALLELMYKSGPYPHFVSYGGQHFSFNVFSISAWVTALWLLSNHLDWHHWCITKNISVW